MRVVIVGGGASGLVAAIYAKRNGNDVIIVEKNNRCGKKILSTGNGRCNYWNQDQDISHYHSDTPQALNWIMTEENQREILSFFENLGMVSRIKNGYYYPYSNQASTVQSLLLKEVDRLGIERKENFLVQAIKKVDSIFLVQSQEETIEVDEVILATGSKASLSEGEGNGYCLATSFGHSFVPLFPSLVSLKGEGPYFKQWDGIRAEVIASLFIDGKKVKEEEGEVQLTSYGVSGICVFNLSRFVGVALSHHQKVTLHLQFMPFLSSKEEAYSWFQKKRKVPLSLETLLEGFLNHKLVEIILKRAHLSKEKTWDECEMRERESLIKILFDFEVPIVGTNSFQKAQVCRGGVPLSEIHYETMESKLVPGLFLTGELLDVDGDCGGYNLGFAWISGMIAGKGVGK